MPMDKKDYPDNWKWLSAQVRKRNRGRCELCYAPNGARVLRAKHGMSEYPWEVFLFSEVHPTTFSKDDFTQVKIVLTVHHIDGNRKNSAERNLISLCSKCHLRLDLHKHMQNRKQKNLKKEFFDEPQSNVS